MMYTVKTTKTGLSPYDDKRFVLDDRISRLWHLDIIQPSSKEIMKKVWRRRRRWGNSLPPPPFLENEFVRSAAQRADRMQKCVDESDDDDDLIPVRSSTIHSSLLAVINNEKGDNDIKTCRDKMATRRLVYEVLFLSPEHKTSKIILDFVYEAL